MPRRFRAKGNHAAWWRACVRAVSAQKRATGSPRDPKAVCGAMYWRLKGRRRS